MKGQLFPIKREELYENYPGPADMEDEYSTDYSCRYSLGRDCYCCGAFLHYAEQGRLCTKHCREGMGRGGPR